MVTTYPTIRNQVTENAREISELDDLRTSWVAAYRQKHAEADWWAEGFGTVEHSLETQERVFRMAEQLVGRGIDRLAVFAALRHADGVAQAGSGRLREGDLQTHTSISRGGPFAATAIVGNPGIPVCLPQRPAAELSIRCSVRMAWSSTCCRPKASMNSEGGLATDGCRNPRKDERSFSSTGHGGSTTCVPWVSTRSPSMAPIPALSRGPSSSSRRGLKMLPIN